MRLTIKEKTYSYTPDYQTNTTTWKVQAGAFFKFPVLIGGVNCFVKRFVNMPCGWDLVQALVGESHPHLPEMYAASTETEDQKTVFYLVTSFLEGGILSEILTQRQTQNVDKLAADVLKALAVIHQKGFWFADFCEKNIFWASQFNRFMLIDLDSCEPLHTRPHYAPNEPGYMPSQDFAAPTISFFKNILHTPNFNFHSLRGNLMNFCQLIFMSAKIGHFKNLLAKNANTPFAAAKKIELPTHLLAQFADNELFIKKVFENIGKSLVNSEQILQICDRFIPSSFAALLLNSKPFETPKPQNPINADLSDINADFNAFLKELLAKLNFSIPSIKLSPKPQNPINANWWNSLDDTWKGIFREHCKEKEGSPAFFEEIRNLQQFNCCRNPITRSYRNQIDNLEPIIYLSNLQELNCSFNQIRSLEPLKNLANLQKLNCYSNQINNLEPLTHLTNLQTLNCGGNQISSPQPLKNLANLQKLNCYSNQISSLEPIIHLSNLQELICSYNQISSLEPLRNLANLQILGCSKNQISSLEPLKNLANLQDLNCQNNQISSLEPLTNLANLKELYCSDNQISSLEPLKKLTNLQELNCQNNQISSLEPLTNLINLKEIQCWQNKIADLDGLKDLTNLQILDCGTNQISSLEPLTNLANLQKLYCANNPISSLKPLTYLINLQELYFSRNQISSLEPLQNLANLKKIDCSDNPLSSLELQVFRTACPKCDVKNVMLKLLD